MRRVDGRTILRAWRLLRGAEVDPFSPDAAELIPRVPGWTSLRLPPGGIARQPRVSVLDALRALSLFAQERPEAPAAPTLVGTLPAEPAGVLSTREVVRSLVSQARRELLVVGFAISETGLRDLLARRGLAGVRVTVVGDRIDAAAADIRTHWPRSAVPLTALRDVRPAAGQGRMHAKVIVADRTEALVGSANFTFSGMNSNIELGVRLSGEIAERICLTVEELTREGWLERA